MISEAPPENGNDNAEPKKTLATIGNPPRGAVKGRKGTSAWTGAILTHFTLNQGEGIMSYRRIMVTTTLSLPQRRGEPERQGLRDVKRKRTKTERQGKVRVNSVVSV